LTSCCATGRCRACRRTRYASSASSSRRLKTPSDVGQFTLIEPGDAYPTYTQWLTWRRWFDEHGLQKVQPRRWLYFNYGHQMVQAALCGQGVLLGRVPMVAEQLANGDLIEPLPKLRIDSPLAYFLVKAPRSEQRAEVESFVAWLLAQSRATRHMTGEALDADRTEL